MTIMIMIILGTMVMIMMMKTAEASRSVARSISTRPHDGFGGSLDTLCPPDRHLGDHDCDDGGNFDGVYD